ncbi:phage tail length tape measure family protein [Azospirillum himalayense]|uniref:Phage tail length tape measure family protein n=1 Tax=Azospirillum himalayense TaxID=654847 RepID=A0ABW0GDP7_9PROT
MAGRNVFARIGVQMDADQARRELESINDGVTKLGNARLDTARTQFEQLGTSVGKTASAYQPLTEAQRRAYEQREDDVQQIGRLQRSYATLGGALSALDVQVQHGHRTAQDAARLQAGLIEAYSKSALAARGYAAANENLTASITGVQRAWVDMHAVIATGKADLDTLIAATRALVDAKVAAAAPMQQRIATMVGITAPTSADGIASRQADLNAWSREIDAVRARLVPGEAAVQRYRAALDDLADAQRLGAVVGADFDAAQAHIEATLNPTAIAAQKEAAAVNALIARLSPADKATRDLAASQVLLDKALSGQVQGVKLSADQHAALTQKLKDCVGANDNSARSTKLAAHEMVNLSYQVQDLGVQLVSGQSPFIALAQQGPQAVMAVGGASRAMALLGTAVGAVLSPVGLAVATLASLAVGTVAVGARAFEVSSQTREFGVAIRAMGRDAELTTGQLRAMVAQMQAAGAGGDESRQAVSGLVRNPNLSSGSIGTITALVPDVAAGTNQGVAETAKALGEAFSGGYDAIKKFDAATGALTATQLESIHAFADQGNQAKALAVFVEALTGRYKGLAEQALTPGQRALTAMGAAWRSFADGIVNSGPVVAVITEIANKLQAIADYFRGPTAQQMAERGRDSIKAALGQAQAEYARFQAETAGYRDKDNPDVVVSGFTGSGSVNQRAEQYRQTIAALTQQWQQAEEAVKTATTTATTGTGQATEAVGKSVEAQRKYVDAVAATVKVQTEVATANAATRTAVEARKQAEKEATANGIEGDERTRLIKLRVQEATRGQTSAIMDQLASLSLAAQGYLALADAYGTGEVAALQQKAANDAVAAAATNAAVNVAELTRQNLLNAASQQAAQTAQAAAGLKLETEWTLKVAEATKDGIGARDEMQRKADVAKATSQLLAYAQAAEAQGSADLAKRLRDLAGEYDRTSKAAAQARQMSIGAEAVRSSKSSLDYAKAELSLMGQMEPVRERALKSLQIQQQAMELFKDTSTDALRQQRDDWIALQEQIADAQAIKSYQLEVQNVAKDIARDWTETMYDAIILKDKNASIIDAFRALGKRIALALLETNIVLPITTAIVGSAPGLFGINTPANQNAAGLTGQASSMATNWAGGKALSWAGDKLGITGSGGITGAIDSFGYSAFGLGGAGAYAVPGATAGTVVQGGMILEPGAGAVGMAEAVPGAAGATAGLSAYLGAAGIGAAAGSLLGGWAGSQANSKAVGGLTGAAAGAGAGALAGTFLFPGVGTLVGALIGGGAGGLGGLIGTQKATVGPNSQGNVVVSGGRFAEGPSAADNGGDATGVRQATAQIAAAFNAMADAYGLRAPDGIYGLFEGGPKVKGNGVRTPEELIRQLVGSLSADGLVGRALGSDVIKGSADLEQIDRYLSLARSIETATTALSDLDKSLAGVQKAAFKAAADGLQPMLAELRAAGEIGASAEYKALVSGQVANLLDDIANPQKWTETQTAVATLTGQLAAWKSVLEQVNPELAATVDTIQRAGLERIYGEYRKSWDASMNEATDRGYLNQLTAVRDRWNASWADDLSAGRDPTKLYEAQAKQIFAGLAAAQLETVVGYFAELDPVMSGLAKSQLEVVRATEAQTTASEQAAALLAANKGLDSRYFSATGRGYLNDVQGLLDSLSADRETLSTGGQDDAKAYAVFWNSLQSSMSQLSAAQMDDVAATFGDAVFGLGGLVRSLRDTAAATAAATAAQQAQVQAAQKVAGTIQSLTSYASGLAFSDLSALAPEQQYSLATSQFNAVSGAAVAGDYNSLSQLQSYSDAYLRTARQQFGSGQGYADAFARVTDVLSRVATVDPDRLTASAMAMETRTQTATINASLGDLIAVMKRVEQLLAANGQKPARVA